MIKYLPSFRCQRPERGRNPSHLNRLGLPICLVLWSSLDKCPTVAMHSCFNESSCLEGSWRIQRSPTLRTRRAREPAVKAIEAPSPTNFSTQLTKYYFLRIYTCLQMIKTITKLQCLLAVLPMDEHLLLLVEL